MLYLHIHRWILQNGRSHAEYITQLRLGESEELAKLVCIASWQQRNAASCRLEPQSSVDEFPYMNQRDSRNRLLFNQRARVIGR